jgi:hypothetical protein
MGYSTAEPLSLDEAKDHMRAVWAAHSPSAWVQRHPYEAVLTAAVTGLVVGLWTARRPPPKRAESRLSGLFHLIPSGLGTQLASLLLQGIVSGGAAGAAAAAATTPPPTGSPEPLNR